ncbi:MAG: hypothetical protein J6R12_03440 [Bacteroidales bacterium]|nr:hypothetical protein [Bacteroidales bacterium]
MNTRKHILIVMLVCLLSACSSDRYAKDIVGSWVLEQQNDESVDCDHIIILEFHEDGSMNLAKIYSSGHNYKTKWIESARVNRYEMNGRRLHVKGRTGNGLDFKQEAYIKQLDSLHLCKKVHEYHVGTIDQTIANGHYDQVYHRLDRDYPKPSGMWELVSLNGKRFSGFRFEFKENGTYDLWIDINGRWELKNDNNGTWFTYGNILCTNYFNDIFKEELSYENVSHCYRYSINDKSMTWESDAPGSNSFSMKKIN